LTQALPELAIQSQPENTGPYECDGLTAYRTRPLAVVLPETEAQAAAILKLCEIGRQLVEVRVARPPSEKALRWLLKEGLTSPLFAPAMKLGQRVCPLLPVVLKNKVPAPATARAKLWPKRQHSRKVLLLAGYCCALRTHLGDHEGGLTVQDYGHALAHDPASATKAARVSALTRDLRELLPELVTALSDQMQHGAVRKLAFHPPCSLQHGQQLRGGVETHLQKLGFEVWLARAERHLCCGSAGTYLVLQPTLAYQLRDRKIKNLARLMPHCIVSANVGCMAHLQSGTSLPVRHWVEVLDEALGNRLTQEKTA
jgi:glycolate oxidase iron-sulfur subunit